MKAERIAIAVSKFNEHVTERLLASCRRTLERSGVRPKLITRVPGGFELPWTVNELALSGNYEAIIALGCIMKGQTPQNDHLARSVIHHLHDISVRTRVPVILGVITPSTQKQALDRTRGENDRGEEAALAALMMLKQSRLLKESR